MEFESTGSARDPFGNLRIGFEGHTTLSRKDWGLTWNAALETGGFLVSDKIKLDFDISAIRTRARTPSPGGLTSPGVGVASQTIDPANRCHSRAYLIAGSMSFRVTPSPTPRKCG